MEIFHNITALSDLSWEMVTMWAVSAVLLYLAISRRFEPLLLVPLAFGAFIANLPGHEGLRHLIGGMDLRLFPPLLFLGVGALTDFGPLIASPRTLILGAAAQFGLLAGFLLAAGLMQFTPQQSAVISIVGAADGPTSIFTASRLSPELLATVTIAAYSYMSLVPLIQPPIMRALTTSAERKIKMQSLRTVSRVEKLFFIIAVTLFCLLIVPESSPLISMLMLGNLLRESGTTDRLARTCQNEIIDVVTIFLGLLVGLTMRGDVFLHTQTLLVLIIGLIAFSISTATGILLAKLLNLIFPNRPINPLIGAAGVSAIPMSARAVHIEGQRADPHNFLLMHAMGPNLAGVIGTALAAGYYIATLAR